MKLIKPLQSIFLFILLLIGCGDPGKFTAFKNTNLVPMTGEMIIENQTLLVKGDRIFAIGPTNQVEIPPDAKVIEGQGAYLMPGLADMHAHLAGGWPLHPLDLYLANGVTTVRDLDGRDYMLQWRDEIRAGKRSGPTLYVAAPTIRGDEKNATELAAKSISAYDCIKLHAYFSGEEYRRAMEIAKTQKLYTVGHIPFAVGLEGVLAAGMDEISHIAELGFELIDFDRTKHLKPEEWLPYVIDQTIKQNNISAGFDIKKLKDHQRNRFSAVIGMLQSADIPICSGLVVDDVMVQKLLVPEAFLAYPQNRYLPQKYRQAFRRGKEKHQLQFKGIKELAPFKYELDKTLLVELHRAEVPIVLGTGAGSGKAGIVPGFSLHDELRILVENGFSPYEAIAAGTVNASKAVKSMTGKNDFGTIEVGKRADFILINRNPLKDVSHIRDYRGVMAAGQFYEAAYLQATISPELLPAMPIGANVIYVHGPDNSFNTKIEVVIGENFGGILPEDIDSISVSITDSNGISSPLALPQYRYFEQFRDFWFSIDGPPKIGKYAFTVTGKGITGTATDYQTVNRMIPHFDTNTLTPAQGYILTSRTPNFAWAPLEYPDTEIYYRLIIEEPSGKRVYSTDRVQNMFSRTVPEDTLKPGRTYRWCVRAMDSGDWGEMQNRSDSPWLDFTMADESDDFPVFANIYNVRESDNRFRTHIDIFIGENFTGKLPDDIDSIAITGPRGSMPINKDDFTYFPELRAFWTAKPGSPVGGTYTFTVNSGNKKASATDTQCVLRSLPIPDAGPFSPADGETLASKGPTFSWGAVEYPDAPLYYRMEIWNPELTHRAFASKFAKNKYSCTVPAGRLQPGKTYIWRVVIFDSISWDTFQNRASGKWQTITMAENLK